MCVWGGGGGEENVKDMPPAGVCAHLLDLMVGQVQSLHEITSSSRPMMESIAVKEGRD